MAMAVAAAIDAIKLKEIVGCIAGDDTIMLVSNRLKDFRKTARMKSFSQLHTEIITT